MNRVLDYATKKSASVFEYVYRSLVMSGAAFVWMHLLPVRLLTTAAVQGVVNIQLKDIVPSYIFVYTVY